MAIVRGGETHEIGAAENYKRFEIQNSSYPSVLAMLIGASGAKFGLLLCSLAVVEEDCCCGLIVSRKFSGNSSLFR